MIQKLTNVSAKQPWPVWEQGAVSRNEMTGKEYYIPKFSSGVDHHINCDLLLRTAELILQELDVSVQRSRHIPSTYIVVTLSSMLRISPTGLNGQMIAHSL